MNRCPLENILVVHQCFLPMTCPEERTMVCNESHAMSFCTFWLSCYRSIRLVPAIPRALLVPEIVPSPPFSP